MKSAALAIALCFGAPLVLIGVAWIGYAIKNRLSLRTVGKRLNDYLDGRHG